MVHCILFAKAFDEADAVMKCHRILAATRVCIQNGWRCSKWPSIANEMKQYLEERIGMNLIEIVPVKQVQPPVIRELIVIFDDPKAIDMMFRFYKGCSIYLSVPSWVRICKNYYEFMYRRPGDALESQEICLDWDSFMKFADRYTECICVLRDDYMLDLYGF